MKTPIEPKDIRAGDLIRWESPDGDEAHESRITNPRATGFTAGQHYLLDRPEPAVDLPTEPTLGWLGFADGEQRGSLIGRWYRFNSHIAHDDSYGSYSHEFVTAFTPATAVPTSALDELRQSQSAASRWTGGATARMKYHEAITAFLAAVDAAGDPR